MRINIYNDLPIGVVGVLGIADELLNPAGTKMFILTTRKVEK
jgi:hypothetical protein